MSEYKTYKQESIPSLVISIEDEFSKELVESWIKYESKGYIYIVEYNGDLAGYCLIDESNTIRGLFVKPKYRNLGIGTKLLKCVINDYDSITVNINKPAVKVYTRVGFTILGERQDMDFLIGYYGDLSDKQKEKLVSRLKKDS